MLAGYFDCKNGKMKNMYVTLQLLLVFVNSNCSGTLSEGTVEQEHPNPSKPMTVSLEKRNLQSFKTHNGVSFSHLRLLPENYQAEKTYPAMLVFPAIKQHRDRVEWVVEELFSNSSRQDWIVMVLDAPKDHKNASGLPYRRT